MNQQRIAGAKVRQLRQEAGLTQTELASGICTPSMISQIEADKANPSESLRKRIAEKLNTTVEALAAS